MRVIIRPSSQPQTQVDITHSLVAALARELSRLQPPMGEREERQNWREAELLLDQIAGNAEAGPCGPTTVREGDAARETTLARELIPEDERHESRFGRAHILPPTAAAGW